ncbi:hypothetical protein DFP72DRAFT_1169332 [Ephemerocybe angulata]|uniref:Uncharacterized protein n=1 Tax=Ephemerocybe angulata TaxID=980116 RepID=A0A8H6M7J5_9AGAR|nr:hypothetical protein DFP72DRAFT_1169332 [Tulosesus angulatus]
MSSLLKDKSLTPCGRRRHSSSNKGLRNGKTTTKKLRCIERKFTAPTFTVKKTLAKRAGKNAIVTAASLICIPLKASSSISMSKVSLDDLALIGISEPPGGLGAFGTPDIDTLFVRIRHMQKQDELDPDLRRNTYQELGADLELEWLAHRERMAEDIQKCVTSFGGKDKEAYARQLIHCVLDRLLFLKRGRVQLWLETWLSTSKPSSAARRAKYLGLTQCQIAQLRDPSTFEHQGRELSLVGYTDFLAMSVPADQVDILRGVEAKNDNFDLNKVIRRYNILTNRDIRLFVVEAKSRIQNLESNVAQAVSETLVNMKKAGGVGPTLEYPSGQELMQTL